MSSLGETLRSSREQQQISVRDVEQHTSIRSNILQAIENEDWESLPAPYMKSFVKRYAQYLKINEEEIQDEINEAFMRRSNNGSASPLFIETPRNGSSTLKKYIKQDLNSSFTAPATSVITKVVYAALTIAVVVVVIYFQMDRGESGEADGSELSGTVGAPLHIRAGIDSEQVKPATEYHAAVQSDSLVLDGVAQHETWLSVLIDGKTTWQGTLKAGDRHRWSATDHFKLTLGNAGGLRFVFNGENVEPLGKKGTVLPNVRINSQGIFAFNKRIFTPGRQRKAEAETPAVPETVTAHTESDGSSE